MFEALLRQFVFVALLVEVITNVLKYSIGRPRPNFYTLNENHEEDNWKVDSRLSFPSGHTSTAFAMYSLLSMYLYKSLRFAYDRRFEKQIFLSIDNVYSAFCIKLFHSWKSILYVYFLFFVFCFLFFVLFCWQKVNNQHMN